MAQAVLFISLIFVVDKAGKHPPAAPTALLREPKLALVRRGGFPLPAQRAGWTHHCPRKLSPTLHLTFPCAVSASRQRQPAFSRVEQAAAVAVGAVPDCAANLFMRAGLPCLTFLYAPSVSCGGEDEEVVCRKAGAEAAAGCLEGVPCCAPLHWRVTLRSRHHVDWPSCLAKPRPLHSHKPMRFPGACRGPPQGNPAVEAVVRGVMERNEPPIPPSRVLGLANASAVDAWLLQHPETALAAVIFSPANASAPSGDGGVPLAATSASWNGTSGVALPADGMGALAAGAGADGYGTPPGQLTFAAAAPASTRMTVGQLGFTLQTNSSVQWFKGSYQHPNTYIQVGETDACCYGTRGLLPAAAARLRLSGGWVLSY